MPWWGAVFAAQLPMGAVMAFLVFGPMMDIKKCDHAVWQPAEEVYPAAGRDGFRDRCRRSVRGVSAGIGDGFMRKTQKSTSRHL